MQLYYINIRLSHIVILLVIAIFALSESLEYQTSYQSTMNRVLFRKVPQAKLGVSGKVSIAYCMYCTYGGINRAKSFLVRKSGERTKQS